MLKNYFTVAWRNLRRSKISSFINIGGLSVGMAVAMVIALWMYDELSYNHYHKDYSRIALVMENRTANNGVGTSWNTPPPTGDELRKLYGKDFKHVLMSSQTEKQILSNGDKHLIRTGYYIEPGAVDMLSVKMLKGEHTALNDPSSLLLSASVAKAFFGNEDPMGKLMKIDNRLNVKVAGVYEDIPNNSDFNDMLFIAPWQLYYDNSPWIRKGNWDQDGFQTYVQVADNADMNTVSAKIKDLKLRNIAGDISQVKQKPEMFLFPMNKWHLYSDFENGKSAGGDIKFVWLFGIIGVFVLLLACINFMNLSTARSEKRAREVGIRKTLGSLRSQLVRQFLSESMLVVALAFVLSLSLVQLMLPFFNAVAGKKIAVLWSNPLFWLAGVGFSIITALVAGSYPAFYLSSFRPVKVLKGIYRAGRYAAVPRKVLVVVQFTVSIALIIGVIIVFRQIGVGKDRPLGYNKAGLVTVQAFTSEIHDHIDAVSDELKKSGAATGVAESINPVTRIGFAANGLDWDGTGAKTDTWFAKAYIMPGYGATVGWNITDGRDFSNNYASDSTSLVLNETAVKFMGLKKPVGSVIKITLFDKTVAYTVIGVIKDMMMESPYRPVRKTIYMLDNERGSCLNIRLNPSIGTTAAIAKIEQLFKKYSPASPFEYHFVDELFARKFSGEERIGKLSMLFAVLAIFISCLGLFGMASFVAEQRTKEIGVRKVLGASVLNLWGLLSKDFVAMVMISLLIAGPTAWYFMNDWLKGYEYRTTIPWWIFAVAGAGALGITLLTVSYQSIKAALMNPVKSLRTE